MNAQSLSQNLPNSVRQLVYGVLTEERQPQWIETDDELKITRVMGAGLLSGASAGENLGDRLPCVIGCEGVAPIVFPKVNLDDARAIDVHIFRGGPGFEVLLLDSSVQHDDERRLQQQSYEVALLNRRLKKLTAELEKARASAEAASQAKSRFISGMSHEFRTPLTSILGFSDLMRRGIAEPGESIGSINESANYLLSLVDNLLEHGSLESGDIRLHSELVDLDTFFDSLARLAEPLAARKGLEFVLQGPEDSAGHWVEIDLLRFRQILINLVSNAIRYTESGSVTLAWSLVESRLKVSVADTGRGISEADIERIFLPFTRAKSGPVNSKSLGLGLSICRQLVEAMDGKLSVSSEPGTGSVFDIEIRVLSSAGPETDADAAPPAARILVVDDDPNIRAVLELALADAGFAVTTAADQLAAEASLEDGVPELALVDLDLYGRSGLAVVSELKRRFPELPVLAMSAASTDSVRTDIERAGCAAFIEKPFDFNQVTQHIRRVLRQ